MATDTPFQLHDSPSHLLHRAQQIAANQSAAALKDAGLTLRQFSVLAVLEASEGVSQSDLVSATGIDRSTLADMVARMESAGLIKRTASKTDARAKSVSSMAKGRRALAKARPAVEAADEALLEMLPKTRQSALLNGLTKLVATAEAEDAAPAAKAEPAPAAKPAPKRPARAAAKPKAASKPKAKTPRKSAAKPTAKATSKAAAKPKKKATKKKKKKS